MLVDRWLAEEDDREVASMLRGDTEQPVVTNVVANRVVANRTPTRELLADRIRLEPELLETYNPDPYSLDCPYGLD